MRQFLKRRLAALVLAALLLTLCLIPSSTAATSIICTVLNDQIMPLEDATMPQRRGSTFYVPYSHFVNYMGLRAIWRPMSQTLTLYRDTSILYFNLAQGTVSDEADVTYSLPAFQSGGTPYVPVSLVCNKFGLFYSYISHTTPILRISSYRPTMSDSTFVQMGQNVIANMVYAYQQQQNSGNGGETAVDDPGATPGVQPDPAANYPEQVALSYDGALNDDTLALVDTLAGSGLSATFFVTPDSLTRQPDAVRAILGRGHTLGLLITGRDALEQVALGQSVLTAEFYTHTLLLRCSDGQLTGEDRQQLEEQGYRLWGYQVSDPAPDRSAAVAVRRMLSALENAQGTPVLRLTLDERGAALTARLGSQLTANAIAATALYDAMDPQSQAA